MSANKPLKNPFEGQRWEQDAEHIIYLPRIFAELEKKQDLYINGSRGTGKTTFLKALNWKTRMENRSIDAQIKKEDLFKNKYIGIYINSLSFGDSIFERGDTEDYSLMLIYSLWVELNVLYNLINAIKGLYEKDYIDFSIKEEQSQCYMVYEYLFHRFGNTILKNRKLAGTEYDITLLEELINELRYKVVDEKDELKCKCDSYSFGNLIEETVPKLLYLCDKENEIKWCTKICFDAIESAPKFHKIVNTFVAKKLSEQVWFIVSGLTHRLINTTDTYIPNHNLTNDDKAHVDLDKIFFLSSSARSTEFESLAEGICDLRLKRSDDTIDAKNKFDITAHLGNWTMNQILDVYLKDRIRTSVGSVSNEFDYFMNLVKKNHEKNEYLTDFPPYIETYYYDILGKLKTWEGPLQKSRQKNRDTGKKYVVIMLALLRNYKLTSTPYTGKRQFMYLCNSTREFLQLMEALFDVRMKKHPSKDISDFFSFEAKLTKSEIQAQTEATIKVAEDKYKGIKNRSNKEIITKKMSVFIDTFGNILYDLQAKQEFSSLISDEKSIFTVSFKNDIEGEKLIYFLKTAADDTYINILKEYNKNDLTTIDFELSRLFAPKYRFSFRPSRNKINIDGGMLKDLCINGGDSFENASQKLAEHTLKMYKLKSSENNKPKTRQNRLF